MSSCNCIIMSFTYLIEPYASFLDFEYQPYSPSVIADFTIPGESHLYGLPLSLCRLFGPMDLFYTFDVSNIIPKNMLKFLYMNFKPFLAHIHGFGP